MGNRGTEPLQVVSSTKLQQRGVMLLCTPMARKKHPGGRPPKGEKATVRVVGVRLTEADSLLLDTIQAQEQAAADRLGITLSPADALRIALRREAERRGLTDTMAQAS